MSRLQAGVNGLRANFTFLEEDGSPLDLTRCSEIVVVMKRPPGQANTKYTRNASLTEIAYTDSGTNGRAYILTRAGEMDAAGNYEWQGFATNADGHYPSDRVTRTAYPSLSIPE